jgi:hypothetical protein
MRMSRIVVLLPLLLPTPARADVISYTDGATHDVSTPTDGSYIVWDSTLSILPGASVRAASTDSDGASIAMSGGQVTNGISIDPGKLDVSGGQVRGSDSSSFAGNAVTVTWGTASISGGTFTGGNSSFQPGSGVAGLSGTINGTPTVSTLNISGGTFIGGTGSGAAFGNTGYSLISSGDTTVTGGHFLSPIDIFPAHGAGTDFLGTNLTYHDNILSGMLQNGDAIDVRVYGSSASVSVNDSGTEVRFLGPGVSTSPPSSDSSSSTSAPAPIPEPGSALVFGVMAALGLAWRGTKSRR